MKGFFIILDIGCSTILQRQTIFRTCSIFTAPPVLVSALYTCIFLCLVSLNHSSNACFISSPVAGSLERIETEEERMGITSANDGMYPNNEEEEGEGSFNLRESDLFSLR